MVQGPDAVRLVENVFRLTVDDVFAIRGRGLVTTGRVESGRVRVGDEVQINGEHRVRVDGIERFRKTLDEAAQGENVGLLFRDLGKADVRPGDVLTAGGFEVAL